VGESLAEIFLKETTENLEEHIRKYGIVGLLDDFECFLIRKDLMKN